jgi:hypothetical protein
MANELPFTGERILACQNQKPALQKLAAQRYLYSSAKRILSIQLVLIIPIPIIFVIFAAAYPDLRVWAAAYGIVSLFVTAFYLERKQQEYQQLAASIQELLDTEIFELEWPRWKARKKPDPEDIVSAAGKYRVKSPDCEELKNWYPIEIVSLPFPLARLVCQRASIRYDSQLRKYYSNVILGALVAVVLSGFIYAIIAKTPFDQVVLFLISPFLPFGNWGVREYFRQESVAESLGRIKEYVQEIWEKSLWIPIDLGEAKCEARNIQDQIYDMRRSNPLIFDFIYRRNRLRLESEMDKGTKELVREALISLK